MEGIDTAQKPKKTEMSPARIAGAFAAALGAASPAVADTPAAMEPLGGNSTSTEHQINKQAMENIRSNVLPKALAILERHIKLWKRYKKFKDRVSKYERQKEEILENFDNVDYISRLSYLSSIKNIDINSIVRHVPVSKILEKDFLESRLENIPLNIRGKFKISSSEFSVGKDYRSEFYQDDTLKSTVLNLSNAGLILTIHRIKKLIDDNLNTDKVYDILTRVNTIKNGDISSVVYYLSKEGNISNYIYDSEFFTGMEKLLVNGFKSFYDLNKYLTLEKAKSIRYINNAILLKRAGFEKGTYRNIISILSLDLGENDDFIQSMLNFKTKISKFNASHINIKNIDRLTTPEVINAAQQLSENGFSIYTAIEIVTHDKMTLDKLVSKDFINVLIKLQNSGTSVDSYTFDRITLSRVYDKEYMDMVYADKKSYLLSKINAADKKYLATKVVNPEKLLMSIIDYINALEDKNLTPLVREILSEDKEYVYRIYTADVNERHEGVESSDKLRVREIKDLSPRVLFDIIRIAGIDSIGERTFTSTFQLLYNGKSDGAQRGVMYPHSLMGRISESGGKYNSIDDFLKGEKISDKDMAHFFEVLTQRGVLDNFMASIGDDAEQLRVSESLFFGLENLNMDSAQSDRVFALYDVVTSLEDATIRTSLLNKMHGEIDVLSTQLRSLSTEHNKEKIQQVKSAIVWYKLIIVKSLQNLDEEKRLAELSGDMKWASGMYTEISPKLPSLEELSKEKLFVNIDGVMTNLHQVYTYDDRGGGKPEKSWDGHLSIRSYMRRIGVKVSWDKSGVVNNISSRVWEVEHEANDGYFMLTRSWVSNGDKYQEKLFINTPDRQDGAVKARERIREIAGVKETGKKDNKSKTGPMMSITEVGHSYNVEEGGFKEVTPNVNFVNLRSCGGHANVKKILDRNPGTLVWSTPGTGTELVNNVHAEKWHQAIRYKMNVNFKDIDESTDRFFAKEAKKDGKGSYAQKMHTRSQSYVSPYKNGAAQIYAAHKSIMSE